MKSTTLAPIEHHLNCRSRLILRRERRCSLVSFLDFKRNASQPSQSILARWLNRTGNNALNQSEIDEIAQYGRDAYRKLSQLDSAETWPLSVSRGHTYTDGNMSVGTCAIHPYARLDFAFFTKATLN